MRAALVAIAAVVATCVVACGGGGGGAEPLTLEQRLLRESEVPGSKPDPRETRLTARSLDEFVAFEEYVVARHIGSGKLEEAGFVSAIHDTRFFPKTSGGPHTPDAQHVRMLVIRFETEEGAATGADLLREEELKPCPGTCAVRITEFDVSGVPDARGIRHSTSAADLEATGEPGEPGDSYTIVFTDGPFLYGLAAFGPPGEVSKEQVEELAKKVHDRVEGAPAPGT